ncbi:hypothetical protein [Georgenia sp. MJ170]|uniref:hypothetical protein n=1 Tax=Georgenia sunbinii TaxID=3117728 RepID=UPI002F267BBE
MSRTKRPGLARVVVGVPLMVATIALVVIEPEAWLAATVVLLVLLASVVWGLVELLGIRLRTQTKVRLSGGVLLLLGGGFAAAAVVTVLDPTALPESAVPRVTPAVKVVLGVLGAVVFGGIGLVALIRAGKPPR